MKELIKLLNEGWKIQNGKIYTQGETIAELRKTELVKETDELIYKYAYVMEDANGKVRVIIGNKIEF